MVKWIPLALATATFAACGGTGGGGGSASSSSTSTSSSSTTGATGGAGAGGAPASSSSSSSASTAASSSTSSTSASSGTPCAHPICMSSGHLMPACDPCVTKLCQADPYCCMTTWDPNCIGEVKSICGVTCP